MTLWGARVRRSARSVSNRYMRSRPKRAATSAIFASTLPGRQGRLGRYPIGAGQVAYHLGIWVPPRLNPDF